jgi:hypothetical protein
MDLTKAIIGVRIGNRRTSNREDSRIDKVARALALGPVPLPNLFIFL